MSDTIFFKGWKTFYDGIGWIYQVKIENDLVEIRLYPDPDNPYYPDKKNPVKVIYGYIANGKIKTSESSFKYENRKFYELNNEGTWNEYFEI